MTFYELVCPTCTLKALTTDHYITCPGCNTLFYASQSAHRNPVSINLSNFVKK